MIGATASHVWKYLTTLDLIKSWMGDPEMLLKIETTWEVGSPIVISGFHHTRFVNKGFVQEFIPDTSLRYTHLSSVSRLADIPENYSVLSFKLLPDGNKTELVITIRNFPTAAILKHMEFYWSGTANLIKEAVEKG